MQVTRQGPTLHTLFFCDRGTNTSIQQSEYLLRQLRLSLRCTPTNGLSVLLNNSVNVGTYDQGIETRVALEEKSGFGVSNFKCKTQIDHTYALAVNTRIQRIENYAQMRSSKKDLTQCQNYRGGHKDDDTDSAPIKILTEAKATKHCLMTDVREYAIQR